MENEALSIRLQVLIETFENENIVALLNGSILDHLDYELFLSRLLSETRYLVSQIAIPPDATNAAALKTTQEQLLETLQSDLKGAAVLFNPTERQILVGFLKQARALVGALPTTATLSPEDRARLLAEFAEAQQRLKLEDAEMERLRYLRVWQAQIREYNLNVITRLKEANPQLYPTYEAGFNRAALAMLEAYNRSPNRKQIAQIPHRDLFKEFLAEITLDLNQEIETRIVQITTQTKQDPQQLRQQLNLSRTQIERAQRLQLYDSQLNEALKLNSPTQLQESIRQERDLAQILWTYTALTDTSAENTDGPQIRKALEDVTPFIQQDLENDTIPSFETLLSYSHRYPAVYHAVESRITPRLTLETPLISVLANGFEESKTEAGITEKKLTSREIFHERKELAEKLEALVTRSYGTITEQQLRILQNQFTKKLDTLEQSGFQPDQIKQLRRQVKSLTIEDVHVLQTEEQKKAGEPQQIKSGTEIARLIGTRHITATVIEYQELIKQGKITGLDTVQENYLLLLVGNDPELQRELSRMIKEHKSFQQIHDTLLAQQVETELLRTEGAKKTTAEQRTIRRDFGQTAPEAIAEPDFLPQTFTSAETPAPMAGGGIPLPSAQSAGRAAQIANRLLPSLLGRGASAGAQAAATAAASTPWGWIAAAILITVIVVITGYEVVTADSEFVPTNLNASISSQTSGNTQHQLAAGTCPVPDPHSIINGTYANGGHGTNYYWDSVVKEKRYNFSIPDGGIYTGCNDPSCPYYGLAIDVVNGARTVGPIVVPYLCDKQVGCTDEEMTWNVYDSRNETVYLESHANGRHWKIVFIHINWNNKDTYIARRPTTDGSAQSDVVGTMVNQDDKKNTHVHFEVVMDSIPIDPTPFCSGAGFVEPTPGGGTGNGQCTIPPATHECAQLPDYWGAERENASRICYREAPGGSDSVNINCSTRDYSIGLFQINLLGKDSIMPPTLENGIKALGYTQTQNHPNIGRPNDITRCWDAFNWSTSDCRDVRPGYEDLLNFCVNWLKDPDNNSEYAHMYQQVSGWSPWSTSEGCGL